MRIKNVPRRNRFLIGGLSVTVLIMAVLFTEQGYQDGSQSPLALETTLSPEVFNSALSPVGEAGGAIIPASCSIGEPCDTLTGDAFCPCAPITVTFSQTSANVFGGDYLPWNFTSTNAATCDFSTTMSASGVGPAYTITAGATSASYNPGPFANMNGWVRYRVTCFDSTRTLSAFEELTINTNIRPDATVAFTSGASTPFVNIKTFNGGADDETSGSLSWEVEGQGVSCTATGGTGWSGTAVSLPTGNKYVYSGTSGGRRTYSLTCSNAFGTVSKTTSILFEGISTCFIPGTDVAMATGESRDIETIVPGELVKTSTGIGEVERVWELPHNGLLYAFNGSGHYFVTASHPFMTSEGWKSFDPEASMQENPGLAVTLLEVGDTLLKEDGSTELLRSVETKESETSVYNLRIKGDTKDFFADGYWVHNAQFKPEP